MIMIINSNVSSNSCSDDRNNSCNPDGELSRNCNISLFWLAGSCWARYVQDTSCQVFPVDVSFWAHSAMILSCMSLLSRRLQASVTYNQLGGGYGMSGSACSTWVQSKHCSSQLLSAGEKHASAGLPIGMRLQTNHMFCLRIVMQLSLQCFHCTGTLNPIAISITAAGYSWTCM